MKAKKSLGQNFLNSSEVVLDIVRAGNIQASDTILEIGPGEGVLTKALLAQAHKVIAVEKDDRMIPLLQVHFHNEITQGKLTLLHGDILEMNLSELVRGAPYKVIANIPYYITGELLRMFFEVPECPERVVVMVQKEVAERIVASDGKESILSLSVKAFGTPTYIQTVPAHFFTPAPRVDSAILLISDILKNFFTQNHINEQAFFTIIKTGFAHKRKLLIRNLESLFTREKLNDCFEKNNLSPHARAEELTLNDWKVVTNSLKDNL